MTIAWHYVQVVAVWLVVAGLPSIINGLTVYPDARAPQWRQFASFLLDIFSMLTKSDSPGTLKAPLMASKAPPVVGAGIRTDAGPQ